MKSTPFMKILDTVTVTLDTDFQTTVSRLMAQNGICHTWDSKKNVLEFRCDKKGRMWVHNTQNHVRQYDPQWRTDDVRGRIYYVRGEVTAAGPKSIVTVCSVHNRATVIARWIEAIGDIALLLTALLLLIFGEGPINNGLLMAIAAGAALLLPAILRTRSEEQDKDADLEIMKTEMLNRIEAAKYWDK